MYHTPLNLSSMNKSGIENLPLLGKAIQNFFINRTQVHRLSEPDFREKRKACLLFFGLISALLTTFRIYKMRTGDQD